MARKLIFSLFFLVFMIILATCSMVKEEGQSPAYGELPAAALSIENQ
jgi:hypothetical protein